MTLLEKACLGKKDEQQNEDCYVVTPHHAAVIDGSTAKGRLRLNGMTTGKVAATVVAEAVRRMPARYSGPEAVRYLTAALRHVYEQNGLLEHARLHAEDRFTCSCVIYSNALREVWLIGDCQCRFGGHTFTHAKRVDAALTQIRCDILRYLLRKGYDREALMTRDIGREFIGNALREQCAFQNAPDAGEFSYTVMDGFPIDMANVPILSVGPDVEELILASDGYPELFDTWQQTESHLRVALANDPLCCHAIRATKGKMEGLNSFDDRTYLRLRL